MKDFFERGHDPEFPHLFASRRFGDVIMSVQADASGYACEPRKRLDDIRDYDHVEITVWGPEGRVNPKRIEGMHETLKSLFDGDGFARDISWDGVSLIEAHLRVFARSGMPLSEARRNRVEMSDSEVEATLGTFEGALFSGQGGNDEHTLAFGRRLLDLAVERGIDIEPFRELRTMSGYEGAAPKGP